MHERAENETGGQPSRDRSLVDEARESATSIVEQAQESAVGLVGQLKGQASKQLTSQADRLSEELRGASSALHTVGETLRENDQAHLSGYTDTLASYVERAASYVEGKDLDQIISETERFARSRPAVFLGGAFILGLAAARFLKSSSGGTPGMDIEPNPRFVGNSDSMLHRMPNSRFVSRTGPGTPGVADTMSHPLTDTGRQARTA